MSRARTLEFGEIVLRCGKRIRKYLLRCHFILKSIRTLPRQARDQHRDSTAKKRDAFSYSGITRGAHNTTAAAHPGE